MADRTEHVYLGTVVLVLGATLVGLVLIILIQLVAPGFLPLPPLY